MVMKELLNLTTVTEAYILLHNIANIVASVLLLRRVSIQLFYQPVAISLRRDDSTYSSRIIEGMMMFILSNLQVSECNWSFYESVVR